MPTSSFLRAVESDLKAFENLSLSNDNLLIVEVDILLALAESTEIPIDDKFENVSSPPSELVIRVLI